MRRQGVCLRAMIGIGIVTLLLSHASALRGGKRQLTGEKVGTTGSIDWNKGVLYATGLGAISNKEPNAAKAYLRARTFAKLDALRNMLMVVDHVRIDSQTVGADYEAKSDEIRAEVSGIVRGAQVVSERKIQIGNGTMVEVTVATPMYGDRGIASVFVPEALRRGQEAREAVPENNDRTAEPQEPDNSRLTLPAPKVEIVRPPRPVKPPVEEPDRIERRGGDRYTSVIIDTRGLLVDRCIAPKIRRPDGTEVWGTLNIDPDWLIEHGSVIYGHTLEAARGFDRAGSNPLVIRAIGRAGGNYRSDAVISDADADLLLQANERSGFLPKCRVIFLVDPGH